MAIGAYSKTTYVNGTTPAINATNLNNIEQQVADITSAATADGANPTKIWTSTNDGNGGQPPAPKPQLSGGTGVAGYFIITDYGNGTINSPNWGGTVSWEVVTVGGAVGTASCGIVPADGSSIGVNASGLIRIVWRKIAS